MGLIAQPAPRVVPSLLLGVALSAAGPLAVAPAAPDLEHYLEQLQYHAQTCQRVEENKLLLQGELRGKKLTFLVDTGVTMTALRPGSVHGLKTLGELGVVLDDRLLGKISEPSVLLMDKLVIGQAQFVNQPARPHELKMNSIRQAFSGIIGLDFLTRNFCLLDCGAGRIFFRSARPAADQQEALEETLRRSGFSPVAIGFQGLLTIDVSINGQTVCLGIDTGAHFSVLQESQLKRLGLVPLGVKDVQGGTISSGDVTAMIKGLGDIGKHDVRVTILKSLQAGDRTWHQVYFGVADLSAWKIGRADGPAAAIQGLFGSDLLTGHGAVIDFAAGKIWFRPEKPQ